MLGLSGYGYRRFDRALANRGLHKEATTDAASTGVNALDGSIYKGTSFLEIREMANLRLDIRMADLISGYRDLAAILTFSSHGRCSLAFD